MISRLVVVVAFVAICAFGTHAHAQSKRYPASPAESDHDSDDKSKLWNGALEPGRAPYEVIVADVRTKIKMHLVDPHVLAELDDAVKLLPGAPDAYELRGQLELAAKHWLACSDDLAAASTRWHDSTDRSTQLFQLGVCAARAARYSEAEAALLRATSGWAVRAEAWLRLGEVRIAMGKLDEAIGALDAAMEAGEGPQALTRFLLAAAYDRARRPGDAEQMVIAATQYDHVLASLEAPEYPLLGAGEHEYMMGLAYRYGGAFGAPRPEFALVYFRRFLALAPESPWRRRAEEHVHELTSFEFPQLLERRGGTTTVDLEAARGALGKAMPAMRACAAKLPGVIFEVTATRVGPHAPVARDQPRFRTPLANVTARDVVELDPVARADVDAATQCMQAVGERAVLPVPKDRDTYYVVVFFVVAP